MSFSRQMNKFKIPFLESFLNHILSRGIIQETCRAPIVRNETVPSNVLQLSVVIYSGRGKVAQRLPDAPDRP